MPVRTRKLIGTAVLMAWLVAYTLGCMLIGVYWLPETNLARLLFYPIAGVMWVIPTRPLFIWMRGA